MSLLIYDDKMHSHVLVVSIIWTVLSTVLMLLQLIRSMMQSLLNIFTAITELNCSSISNFIQSKTCCAFRQIILARKRSTFTNSYQNSHSWQFSSIWRVNYFNTLNYFVVAVFFIVYFGSSGPAFSKIVFEVIFINLIHNSQHQAIPSLLPYRMVLNEEKNHVNVCFNKREDRYDNVI